MSAALANRLASIRDRGGVKSRDIAQMLDTTPETVSRWQSGKVDPQPDHLKKLLTLEWLIAELAEFYEPDEARLWLFAPHRLLQGDSPAQRIQSGRTDDVEALLAQLRDGAYA
jgi:transcriptional regulator with XRE-family HTH domain